METLSNQIKNASKMATSEEKRKEFDDRMNRITSKYQKIYKFEVNKDKPGHSTWNNEADAFKHTFGSALMAFELGNLGSLAGGIHHEFIQRNNPEDEWNMDSWNNNQGRLIADEIKKEYGEKNFRNFSKEKQEDIIAQKVMDKMKKGDLITHPDDKRKYTGRVEKGVDPIYKVKEAVFNEYEKLKDIISNGTAGLYNKTSTPSQNNKTKGAPTGFAIDTNNKTNTSTNATNANIADEHDNYYRTKHSNTVSKYDDFIQGFDLNAFTDEGVKHAKLQEANWVKKFNVGNPDTDDGHWITLPNGKHLFIKNK